MKATRQTCRGCGQPMAADQDTCSFCKLSRRNEAGLRKRFWVSMLIGLIIMLLVLVGVKYLVLNLPVH